MFTRRVILKHTKHTRSIFEKYANKHSYPSNNVIGNLSICLMTLDHSAQLREHASHTTSIGCGYGTIIFVFLCFFPMYVFHAPPIVYHQISPCIFIRPFFTSSCGPHCPIKRCLLPIVSYGKPFLRQRPPNLHHDCALCLRPVQSPPVLVPGRPLMPSTLRI